MTSESSCYLILYYFVPDHLSLNHPLHPHPLPHPYSPPLLYLLSFISSPLLYLLNLPCLGIMEVLSNAIRAFQVDTSSRLTYIQPQTERKMNTKTQSHSHSQSQLSDCDVLYIAMTLELVTKTSRYCLNSIALCPYFYILHQIY